MKHNGKKTCLPIEVTVSGISMLTRDEQFANAYESISFIVFEKVILIRFLQSKKAAWPIDVIPSYIIICVSIKFPAKAHDPILL